MDYGEKNLVWLSHHLEQLEELSKSWEHLPFMRQNIDSRIEMVKEEIESRKITSL